MNVSNRQLGELAIGVLALYLAAVGLMASSFFIFGVMGGPSRDFFAMVRQGLPFLAYFAVAAILWFGRTLLGERLLPYEEATAIPLRTATIAVRAIGLLMVPRFIQQFWTVLAPPSRVGLVDAALWWLPLIVAGLILAFFIFGGDRLVAHLTSAPAQEEAARIPAVVFAAIGLYMMVTAFPNLVSVWVRIRLYGLPYDWRGPMAEIVAQSLVLLLGAALFLGANVLARAWRSMRSMPPLLPGREGNDAAE